MKTDLEIMDIEEITTAEALEQLGDHLPIVLALEEGIGLARTKFMPSSEGEFSDMELMKLIRVAYCDADAATLDLAGRLDADERAIRRALNASVYDFANRLDKAARD